MWVVGRRWRVPSARSISGGSTRVAVGRRRGSGSARGVRGDADGRSVAVDDTVGRSAGKGWRHALAIALDLVSQHLNLPAHVLMTLLEGDNEVDS